MSEQLQQLEAFNIEVEKYKPKDLIDFSIEYFKALESNTSLDYKNLEGLEPFVLLPRDQEIINRLKIPDEDLVRIINRRKVATFESTISSWDSDLTSYSQMNPKSEDDMHKYRKFKKNTLKNIEFLRFIGEWDSIPIDTENKRIYYIYIYPLNSEEKRITFRFLDIDWTLTKNGKIRDWTIMLERWDKLQKHSYNMFDNVSHKLNEFVNELSKGNRINVPEAEEIYKGYLPYIQAFGNKNEFDIYNTLMSLPQYKRNIIYDMFYIKNSVASTPEIKAIYEKVEKIYNKSFAYLTEMDYYNYILTIFIPYLKRSIQTSNSHREMESFLNKLFGKIPKIYNTNFLEEKKLFFNIECVKYFLNKENLIKSNERLYIEIIKKWIEEIRLLLQYPGVKWGMFKTEYEEVLMLQLREYYPEIAEFIERIIKTIIAKDISKEENLMKTLIAEFKGYKVIDQNLIKEVIDLKILFENDSAKAENHSPELTSLLKELKQSYSIDEISKEIKCSVSDYSVSPVSRAYYIEEIKKAKFNFENWHFIRFNIQNEVIALIIKNNKNNENLAKIYEKEHIQPYIDIHFMTEELYNFKKNYIKYYLDLAVREEMIKDKEKIISKFQRKFPEENKYAEWIQTTKLDKESKKEFFKWSVHQQRWIFTYISFTTDLNSESVKVEEDVDISKRKVISKYLKWKVNYIKDKVLTERTIKNSGVYLDYIYDELNHVNNKIYISVKYNKSVDFMKTFTKSEKKVIKNILKIIAQTENIRKDKEPSLKKIQKKCKDYPTIMDELKKSRPFIHEYIVCNKDRYNDKDNLIDYNLFSPIEKQMIIHTLSLNNSAVGALKVSPNDEVDNTLHEIVQCEFNSNFYDEDVKWYYRSKWIKLPWEKSKIDFIKCIISYSYDPNNTYLTQHFLNFPLEERMIILQYILIVMKVLEFHSLYFDQILLETIIAKTKELITVANLHQGNKEYAKFLTMKFEYLMYFFSGKMYQFIQEIIEVSHQTIYKFVNEFSDKEREIIISFWELYSIISGNEKYFAMREEWSKYLQDSTYAERMVSINQRLDLLISKELHFSHFIWLSEEIKETSKEIDYIVEKIANEDSGEVSSSLVLLFKTLSVEEKNICIKTLHCIQEEKFNPSIPEYLKEFEEGLNGTPTASILTSVKDSMTSIKKTILSGDILDPAKLREKYENLKTMLSGICGDLFEFCDNCGRGNVSVRKLKAINPEKLGIILMILECDYLIYRRAELKKSLEYVSKFKV